MSVELRKEHTSCEGCAIEFKSGYDSVCLKCTDDYLNWCHYAPMEDKPKLVLVIEEEPKAEKISIFKRIMDWLSCEEKPQQSELTCNSIAEEANKINDRMVPLAYKLPASTMAIGSISGMREEAGKINNRMAPLASENKYTPETDIERQNRLSHKAMMDKINKMEWLKD